MATAEQTLQIWQELADRGDEGLLSGEAKTAFENARKKGYIKDNRGFIQKAINPQREDLPELPGALDPTEALKGYQSITGDKSAVIDTDSFGNPVIKAERGRFYINKPGFSANDIRQLASGADTVVKDVAPYVAAGAVTAPAKALTGIAVQGLTGLASESMNQSGKAIEGKPVDKSQLWKTPLFAMAGDAAGRAASAVVAPVLAKIFGKAPVNAVNPDGTLTDDVIKSLDDAGVGVDDFGRIVSDQVDGMKNAGVLTKEQASRFNFLKSQGIENPTKAQVTRQASDFQTQQELAKTSNGLKSALQSQESVLSSRFDKAIGAAGGVSEGSPISKAVLAKATELDNEIIARYEQVRKSLPEGQNVQLPSFFDRLRTKAASNKSTEGLISNIRGYLKEAGIESSTSTVVGTDGLIKKVTTGTPMSVGQTEGLRIELNRLYPNTNREGRYVIRQLKDALDQDVLSVAGKDFFEEARALKSTFEKALTPEKLSKFDANESSLVRDILENNIKGEDVFNNVALSRSWKPSDVKHLKTYLADNSVGQEAWNSLRADTIQWIKDNSFIGAADELGNKSLSRAKLESSLKRIGDDRLAVIFNKDEHDFLKNMLDVAKIREPVPGTQQGMGPSAQAVIKGMDTVARKLPIIGGFWDAAKAGVQAAKAERAATSMLNPTASTIAKVQTPEAILPKNALSSLSAGAAASSNRK